MQTIQEIQEEIIQAKEAQKELKALDSTSKVSIWRLIIYIIAFEIFNFQQLLESHKQEITDKIANLRPASLPWYREKAMIFQYGFSLKPDTDIFDNTGYTEEQILQSKIVKYAAVNNSDTKSRIILKIAGETGGVLNPLTEEQKKAFETYIEDIRAAGDDITVINYPPDLLYLNMTIRRNPLLLDAKGYAITPINGNIQPVENSISEFLRNLPFNGEFYVDRLETHISKVHGVEDISIDSAASAWIDAQLNDYGQAQSIYMSKIPKSGYFATQDPKKNNLIKITYVV